jgi:hypothetical protein
MAAIMIAAGFVPVFEGPRWIELADPARASALIRAGNVKAVYKRNKGARKLVELQMQSLSDEGSLKGKQGNPRRYSHNHAVDRPDFSGNPDRVWTLRPIRKRDRKIFRAVLDSCAA